ncbi:MAG: hypothetical protein JNK05_26355 [Myxococcales bacterium]|nr:hypothetical protein [Myxococcales bacterium]
MDYKYSKRAGALNEVAPQQQKKEQLAPQRMQRAVSQSLSTDFDFAETTGVSNIGPGPSSTGIMHTGSSHAQTLGTNVHRSPAAPAPRPAAVTAPRHRGGRTMFFFTVNAGERVRVIHNDGSVEIVDGPKRFWLGSKRVEHLTQYVAHPGEFLIVRFRDGRQEHHPGPASVWLDPKEHLTIEKEEALPIAAKEAVVVYAKGEDGAVARRVVHGPAMFVPSPGEWLHTFSWHGSKGGTDGYLKVPNALVFQKLWFLPDQMYHDVHDVRTADDAVLTIRLMLFFELVDLPRMLESTHDPIGDFVNAATSDVIDFTGKHDFESFKRHTEKLNELAAYPQLTARAEQCGYRINKVVYRGYGAPDSLQRMHDEAIESRTRLQLERATQQQEQDLEDFKLEREHARAAKQRTEQEASNAFDLSERDKRRAADIADAEAKRTFERKQRELDRAQQLAAEREKDAVEQKRLAAMRELGVDLTKLLTQQRPDRVIEVRGTETTHVHLDPQSSG